MSATFLLPPGKYYIGDPCYVFDNDKPTWDELIEATDCFENEGVQEFKGFKFWAHGTAHGDGTYTDQNGTEYGVDAGLLGAIPIEMIEDPHGEDLGTVIDAPGGLEVNYDEDGGTFYFGHIVIQTDPPYENEEDGGYDLDQDDELENF